jgi:hypothetical protein
MNFDGTQDTNYWTPDKIPKGFCPEAPAIYKWISSDDPINYEKKGNKAYGVDDITYDINSHGYRSIEIDTKSTAKKIMFLGCSVTAGIGLPHHEVWTTVLTKRLEQHFGVTIEQHNFGLPGFGADAMAMVAYQVMPIIKPDLLILMYPDIARRAIYVEMNNVIAFLPYFKPREWPKSLANLHASYVNLSVKSNDFFEWRRNHALIDNVARLTGSKTVWGFTSSVNINYLSAETLSQYLNTDAYYPNISFPLNLGDIARDGIHPGRQLNHDAADKWFDEIIASARLSRLFQS